MRIYSLSAIAAAVTASLFLASCGGGGGGGNETTVVTPPVVQELQNARYQVKIMDAVTGAVISDPLKISFVGTPALKAVDGTSLNGKTVTTSAGLAFVSADFTATADEFSIQVSDAGSTGWMPGGMRVTGTAGLNGDQIVEIRLMNSTRAAAVNASPEPIAMAVDKSGTVTATGATAAAIVVTTAPKIVTTEEGATATIGTASVAIPAGTTGSTSTGAPAAPGPLTVANTYYGNASNESLAAFPGGFAATVNVPAANASVLNGVAPDAGTFLTAGFAQFNVTDSAGNAIKTFDQPLTLGIDMPKGTVGADGSVVAAGGSYPVWSYDDATGTWKFEKMGTVREKTPVDPANFSVQFQTSHLSTWALNTYLPSCAPTVNLQGRAASDQRVLKVEFTGPPSRRFSASGYTSGNVGRVSGRVPDITGTIVVTDGGKEVGRLNNQRFCGVTLNVPLALTAVKTGSVKLETFESCPDGSKQRPVPTNYWVDFNIVAPGVSNSVGSYTRQLATTDLVAQATVASLPVGVVNVRAVNPRTGAYVPATAVSRNGSTTASDVLDGATTLFRFNFPMECKVVTGGS